MIGVRELRLALTGALLFLAVGLVQGCGSEAVTGPGPLQASPDEVPDCYEVNGLWICR